MDQNRLRKIGWAGAVFTLGILGMLLSSLGGVAGSPTTGLTPWVYLPYLAYNAGQPMGTATPTTSPTNTATPTQTPTSTPCTAAILITHIPAWGSTENLQGQVTCVDPSMYSIAVYIYVSGWWNKPYWSSPLTPIQSDGTWSCDVTTGGEDPFATAFATFAVPSSYSPPLLSGQATLPQELYDNSVANTIVDRQPSYKTLAFSGYTWNIKQSDAPVDPGPCYYTDDAGDVWVDSQGRLHLNIVYRNGNWYCSEVFATEPMGYGTYSYTLASRVDTLDPNVVAGLFTWDPSAPQYYYRELDVEFSRWGLVVGPNAQYVVQPWYHAGNRYQFNLALTADESLHTFAWQQASVLFSSYQGTSPNPGGLLQSWTYTGADIPPEGSGNPHLNLWLYNGLPPANGQGVEVIVERFDYAP